MAKLFKAKKNKDKDWKNKYKHNLYECTTKLLHTKTH